MFEKRRNWLIILVAVVLLVGGGYAYARYRSSHLARTVSPEETARAPLSSGPRTASIPQKLQVEHVFIVLGENHSYNDILGNTQDMPYLNSLAKEYAYAANYYANTHPSIGNYFMLTTGQVVTNDDGYTGTLSQDNIIRELKASGKTWKEYSEDIPSPGYFGQGQGGYTEHHNPLEYFSDVRGNKDELKNLVPLSELATDIQNHTLPNYAFIVPNNRHNGHDCPKGGGCTKDSKLNAYDTWLKETLDPLLQSDDFKKPSGGVLVITYDEADKRDTTHGGGHAFWAVVGPAVKRGYVSNTLYQHENTLRFMAELIGLKNFPGKAAEANNMSEFLSSGS